METQSKRIWSFAVTKVKVEAWKFTVEGYLVLMTTIMKGREVSYDLFYVTPPEEPFKMTLPPWAFGDKDMDEISPRLVTRKLVKMFGDHDFEMIPEIQLDVPWHRIPPSKREALRRGKQKSEKIRPLPPEKR